MIIPAHPDGVAMGSVRASGDPFYFMRGGGRRLVNFTVTNACNAKCVYCSFHLNRDPRLVGLDEAKHAIDFLMDHDVGVLSLTGGEPFLNPDLPRIARYAKDRGLVVLTGTNGTLLGRDRLQALKDAGLDALWISYEGRDGPTFEHNRGVPGLEAMVRDGLAVCKDIGLNVFCIALINSSMGDIPSFAAHLQGLGALAAPWRDQGHQSRPGPPWCHRALPWTQAGLQVHRGR
jgi:MoaA/NifB/PqqE/SkfB family radical SAM enzyme